MPLKSVLPTAAALIATFFIASAALSASDSPAQRSGYYRYPSVHGGTVVFPFSYQQ
jgi:hypothetical protein